MNNAIPAEETPNAGSEIVSRSVQWFTGSAGGILALTGGAKLIGALGTTPLLDSPDPVFGFTYRYLVLIVAILELAVAAQCFWGRNPKMSVALVAWLASMFAAYRMAVWLIDDHPCPCLGRLTDVLGWSPEQSDRISAALLAYLLLGSYGIGIGERYGYWLSKQRAKPQRTPKGRLRLSLLLPLTAFWLPQPSFSDQRFGVEGYCRWKCFNEAGDSLATYFATFRLQVEGHRFDLFLKKAGSPADYHRVVGDETTTYYLEDLTSAVKAMKARGEETGVNTAGAIIINRPVPNFWTYAPAGTVWLMYASASYFNELAVFPVRPEKKPTEADVASGWGTFHGSDIEEFRVNRPATWTLLEPGGLPQTVIYYEKEGFLRSEVLAGDKFMRRALSAPYAHGYTNSHFSVLRATNFHGWKLPLEALYTTYWVNTGGRSSNDLWARFVFRVMGTNFYAPTGSITIPPLVSGPTAITDARFVEDPKNPKKSFYYLATNRFPRIEEIKATAAYTNASPQSPLQPLRPRKRSPWVLVLIFATISFVPILLFWRRVSARTP